MKLRLFVLLAVLCQPASAQARNIVLSNDDGLSSNVKALYDALKAQGHDVIVSVPCTNQSGMGAAIRFMRKLEPLKDACRNAAAGAGAPAAGPMTKPGFEKDYFYIDGTPVMATLYGIDVAAMERWGKAPDLVISGPNEGQNVGHIVLTSGTVSNVQYAAARGIPAIAFSAGHDTTDNGNLANPKSAGVAKLAAQLVGALDARAKGGAVLPPGMALNVNFPDELQGARWKPTRIGTYSAITVKFTADVGSTAVGKAYGLGDVHGPGLIADMNTAAPRKGEENDESVVYRKDIAVSPMQAGYDAQPVALDWLKEELKLIAMRE